MKRGISEISVRVVNPLPDIEDADVLEKAGLLETAEAVTLPPLYIDWTYSAGHEREFIRLMPGQGQVMRLSDANVMMHECAERGLCIVQLDATPEQETAALAAGIKRAIQFYTERGSRRLQFIRKKFGLTKEEMDENRHEHWSFYYSQAIADMLRTQLNEIAPNVALAKKRAATKAAQE